jgi:hypothetical protein
MNSRTRTHAQIGALLLSALLTCPASGSVVGSGPGCTHATIQAAIDDADVPNALNLIIVTRSLAYTAQALHVDGKKVWMRGGFDTCAQTTASGSTTISGEGGGHDSVLTITGSDNHVVLQDLSIIRGDEVDDGFGGGIDFRGNGLLSLVGTSVGQNHAGYGGGINVSAEGGHAELQVETGSVILNNIAQFSGGGVRLWGDARLLMEADNTQITGNEALGINPGTQQPEYGFGGGIEVIAPALAEIGSPGLGNNGAIFNNSARRGGGIAVMGEGGNGDFANAKLYSTNALRPGRVQGNRASASGGGIYVMPNSDTFPDGLSRAYFCASDFRIDGNAAPQGAAIHADVSHDGIGTSEGGHVWLNSGCVGGVPSDNVACTGSSGCNSIDENVTRTSAGDPVAGATIAIEEAADLALDRVQLRRNRGGQVLRHLDEGTEDDDGRLRNCLVADNVVSGHLLLAEGGADLLLEKCTFANNSIGANAMIEGSDFVTVRRSIIDQPGKTSVSGANHVTAEQVVATEIASLGGEQFGLVVLDRPRFVDAEHGDYHQMAASRGVDFAPADAPGATDLDRAPRSVDLTVVPDWLGGAADAGAYERQALLPLVRNESFAGGLGQWTVLAPGSVSWISDVAGHTGTVEIRQTAPPLTSVVGLSQCIHLPGPGRYRLNGSGRAIGGLRSDFPNVVWTYRADADDCIGLATDAGELHLPHSTAFAASSTPAEFDSPAGEWTRNSTLEVSLKVVNGNPMLNDGVDAFFDDIVLEPSLGDVIFADGFD